MKAKSIINGLLDRPISVRLYLVKHLVEELSAVAEESKASLSTVVNSAIKTALLNRDAIVKDAQKYGRVETNIKG